MTLIVQQLDLAVTLYKCVDEPATDSSDPKNEDEVEGDDYGDTSGMSKWMSTTL